ncbi:hypothetical protein [Campylobacter sp. RM12651]|uniref:hypothetical protein n=1 Tax=Campylobacter sp. RM12651 TaxID=1660079 RepID=UPI001EFBCBF9|nr:hypothetical protein [Campylobacter sp. RM12651]ULO04527.1 hypothetical protein AVBRAN_a0045 [Campylobacter sp. RM12651]
MFVGLKGNSFFDEDFFNELDFLKKDFLFNGDLLSFTEILDLDYSNIIKIIINFIKNDFSNYQDNKNEKLIFFKNHFFIPGANFNKKNLVNFLNNEDLKELLNFNEFSQKNDIILSTITDFKSFKEICKDFKTSLGDDLVFKEFGKNCFFYVVAINNLKKQIKDFAEENKTKYDDEVYTFYDYYKNFIRVKGLRFLFIVDDDLSDIFKLNTYFKREETSFNILYSQNVLIKDFFKDEEDLKNSISNLGFDIETYNIEIGKFLEPDCFWTFNDLIEYLKYLYDRKIRIISHDNFSDFFDFCYLNKDTNNIDILYRSFIQSKEENILIFTKIDENAKQKKEIYLDDFKNEIFFKSLFKLGVALLANFDKEEYLKKTKPFEAIIPAALFLNFREQFNNFLSEIDINISILNTTVQKSIEDMFLSFNYLVEKDMEKDDYQKMTYENFKNTYLSSKLFDTKIIYFVFNETFYWKVLTPKNFISLLILSSGFKSITELKNEYIDIFLVKSDETNFSENIVNNKNANNFLQKILLFIKKIFNKNKKIIRKNNTIKNNSEKLKSIKMIEVDTFKSLDFYNSNDTRKLKGYYKRKYLLSLQEGLEDTDETGGQGGVAGGINVTKRIDKNTYKQQKHVFKLHQK